MPDFGTVRFASARASGVQVFEVGSGLLDHIGFFGAGGNTSAADIGTFQDTTILIDSNGTIVPHIGSESGKLTNCKYISDTVASISGFGNLLISDVNAFNADNLSTEPEFVNQSSGTLLIEYFASGTQAVHTYNSKIYAYDNTGSLTDPPPDITLYGFEINASGAWFNAGHTDKWKTLHGENDAYFFANHSPQNNYQPSNRHIWVIALSARSNSVGVLDDWNLVWSTQFA